jgi:small subunit ribosomal protein S13
MARIAGVDLPRQKHVNIALTYIYGIGHPRAGRILDEAKVEPMKKVQDLSEEEVNRIRTVIEEQGLVEGDLRKEVSMNIKRLIEIGSYRGFRHRRARERSLRRRRRQRKPKTGLSAVSAWPLAEKRLVKLMAKS